jgi:hypothetical protein
VGELVAALIDGEIAEDGLRPQLQQCSTDGVRVQGSCPPDGVDEELATRVGPGRVRGGRATELFLVRGDELRITGVRETGLPVGTA